MHCADKIKKPQILPKIEAFSAFYPPFTRKDNEQKDTHKVIDQQVMAYCGYTGSTVCTACR
jgi:hypothetical protein